MFSSDIPATPRPRPPAQKRRSASMQFKLSPPPPYAAPKSKTSHLNTLSSSVSAPDISAHSPQHALDPEEPSWMKEKSREELSELLTKADDIIREREHELSLTTAVCKNLYENNVTLKSKHKALLAVIPGTPGSSNVDFPSLPASPSAQSSSSYFASVSHSTSGFQPPPLLRRTRKISVSPSDIALLSDQNAELLQKLEKLETESAQADQVGRRALKRLEKEIQFLREELEKTQAKSEELEEKTRTGFGRGAEKVVEEVWRKKKEREARFRALRGKTDVFGGERNIRDFAPGSGLASAGWSDRSSPSRYPHYNEAISPCETDPAALSAPIPSHFVGMCDGSDCLIAYGPSQDDTSSVFSIPPQENALISQLLLKIQELEETNTQIKEQQEETVTKLQSLQHETQNITRLYECLGDPTNVEWVVDEEQDKEQQVKKPREDDTIRFKSLRRTLEELPLPSATTDDDSDVFKSDISVKHRNTYHGGFPLNTHAHKTRKSVVGLFDSGPDSGNQGPSTRGIASLPTFLGFPAGSEDSIRSRPSQVTSPVLSELSLTTPLHTLGSELGSEFGEDWCTNAGNHHLRTTSLADLADISQTSPSPVPAPFSFSPAVEDLSGARTPAPTSKTGLHLTLETPTPGRPKGNGSQSGTQHSSRYNRMSQTVHSRTRRWVDGRFGDTLTGLKDDTDERQSVVGRPTLGNAFDAVVDTSMGLPLRKELVMQTGDPGAVDPISKTPRKREKRAAVAFVLEVWLWLQFAMIVLVFLWAMAKRGPKTVLKDAKRRSASRNGI